MTFYDRYFKTTNHFKFPYFAKFSSSNFLFQLSILNVYHSGPERFIFKG